MIRIVCGSPATLSATFYVNDVPTDATGTVTVTVTTASGSTLVTGSATSLGAGVYTFPLVPQALPATLAATWSGVRAGSPVTVVTYADVVGSNFFVLSELRNFDQVLTNTTKYPDAKLLYTRLYVEAEFEGICGRGFVPHYARDVLYGDGNHTIWLRNPELLQVLTITANAVDISTMDLYVPDDNLRVLNVRGNVFPCDQKIIVEYLYGKPEAPIRVKNAALKRAKYMLIADQSRIDERATTMNVPDFGNFILATPGMRGSYTGIPDVDVVIDDYALGGG